MTGPDESHRPDVDRLLRWYPAAWRDRYGAELATLVEDELDGARPGAELRLSLARAGLAERARGAGLVGDSRPASERVRSGALLVLVAWAAAVVAGGAFAKVSEHFLTSDSAHALGPARAAYAVVVVGAVAGAAIVLSGAVVALGAVSDFTRAGGWRAVRAPLTRAVVVTAATVTAFVALSVWAHRLNVAQRNGADLGYSVAFLAWVSLVSATIALWGAAGVSVARRLDLGARVLRVEAGLAVAGAAVLTMLTVAVGAWWAAMASAAPWFLDGRRSGTHPVPAPVPLVALGGLLLVAVVTAGYGVVRIVRSWRALAAA